MIAYIRTVLLLVILGSFNTAAYADSELPLPRFVSLKSSEVNVRTGPGLRYKTKWVLIRKSLPVEIVAEFEQWRKIRDREGEEGWVHKSMLSGSRTAIMSSKEKELIYDSNNEHSRPEAYIEPGVIVNVAKCKNGWCKIKADDEKGWIKRDKLWGVYPNEKID